MNDDDRAKLFFEIAKCRNQPGIVPEWVDVELERRHALQIGSVEWVEQKNREWEIQRETINAYQDFNRPRITPLPPARDYKAERAARRQRECEKILAELPAAELKDFQQWLCDYHRSMPQSPHWLTRQINSFRILTKENADKEFFENNRPLETLWCLEMRAHTRIAYKPFKVCNREFSQMSYPTVWDRQNRDEEFEEEFPDEDSGLDPRSREDDELSQVDDEW